MTTVPIKNVRAHVDGVSVEDMDFDRPIPAGVFEFYSDREGPDAGILFGCPCGCGEMKSVGFDTRARSGSKRPKWHWDGNRERPTLTPSVNILQFNDAGQQIGEHWHGFLTNGRWVSC